VLSLKDEMQNGFLIENSVKRKVITQMLFSNAASPVQAILKMGLPLYSGSDFPRRRENVAIKHSQSSTRNQALAIKHSQSSTRNQALKIGAFLFARKAPLVTSD
jgi:predicted amidohydrolase YtcJ